MHIQQLFEEQVRKSPNHIAIIDGGQSITYATLNLRANRLAHYIRSKNLPEGSVLAFLLDNSADTLVCLLGILKSGHAFLSLEPSLPYERQKYMVNDARALLLISKQRYLGRGSKLLWDCPMMEELLSLDSNLEGMAEDEENQLMNPELWDYFGSQATDSITYGGWVSSYTGRPFSQEEMAEYGENVKAKLQPYLKPTARVLEIGCSSGITLFQIAPHVGEYYGVDISEEILKFTEEEVKKVGWQHVKLQKLGAHQLEELPIKNFDIVIVNSVVQSFNGHRYFKKVLKDILQLVNDEAVLFYGDIQDQESKDDLVKSLVAYKNQQTDGDQVKIDWSQELFLSRDFFFDLMHDFPEIKTVEDSEKVGNIENELTKYRYDVILEVDKTGVTPNLPIKGRNKMETGKGEIEVQPGSDPEILVPDDGLAYVLYTSGSTGRPKGVEVSHKNIANYIRWANAYYFKEEEEGSMAFVTSVSFDLTLTSLLSPLCRGRYIYIPKGVHFDEKIEDCLLHSKVDTLKLTPTHLNLISVDKAPHLHRVILGGEMVKKNHIDKLKTLNPEIVIYNEYGPTETTIGSTVAEIDYDYMGIGKPILNTSVFILDRALQIVPINNVGEICIAGDGVSGGYRNQKELSAACFVQNPYGEGKIYKTGDFGKWTEEGNIVLVGRKDKQVKVRGYRLEVEEIEQALLDYPGILSVVVKLMEKDKGDDYLVAYFVSANPQSVPNKSVLTAYLKNLLPSQNIPDFIVPIEEIPLLASGKTDESALPDPEKSALDNTGGEPKGEMELKLSKIWKEVLGRTHIGRESNFFAMNGHSLKAMQMVTKIEKDLDIKVKLKVIFAHPTIKSLSEQLSKLGNEVFKPITPVPISDSYEVSHAQKRLWLADQLNGFSKGSFPYTKFYVQEPLDLAIFERSVMALMDRHESLRTLFLIDKGVLRQVVKRTSEVNFSIAYTELSDEAMTSTELEKIEEKDQQQLFDLEKGPLMKMRVVKISHDKYLILFAIHHIISDGISMQIFIRELKSLYSAFKQDNPNPLPPLEVHYKDYADWHNKKLESEAIKESRNYWRRQLGKGVPPLYFQSKIRVQNQKGRVGRVYYSNIDEKLAQDIIKLGQEFEMTTFIVLQACIAVLLYRNTSQEDMIIGTPISGRLHADLEHQIGLYLNILPLRNKLHQSDLFRDVLGRVKKTTLEAYQHEAYPFDFIISDEEIKKPLGQNMIFDVGFTYHNHMENESIMFSEEDSIGEMETQSLQSSYPLWFLAMRHKGGMGFMVHYNSNLFDEIKVKELMEQLKKIMESVIENSATSIGEIILEKKPDTNGSKVSVKLDL